MSPKEKAEYLINKMYSKSSPDEGMSCYEAKDCALICVEEIIKSSPNKPLDTPFTIEYWDEVKQEIKKL